MGASRPPAPGRSPAPGLRHNREFALLWSGETVSALGSQMSQVAYPLLVLALTGSPARAGVVGFARQLPIMLLALPAGALADHVNRKWLMVTCDGVRGLALAGLTVALAGGDASYGLIIAVAFVDGAGFVVSYVTERGAVRRVVAPADLRQAIARNESRNFGAMLAGPPLGGALFGLGRAIPFLADAVTYLVSTATKLALRTELQQPVAPAAGGGVRDGLRWLWAHPFFRTCSLLFAGSNPVFTGLYLLVVARARADGAPAPLIGTMLAIAAAGGLIGALLAPRLGRRLSGRQVLVGESWMLTFSVALLLTTHAALLMGLILAAGEIVTPVTNAIVVSHRVALAPDHLQGRVQAATTLVSFSAGWAGPLVVGVLLQSAGATATILALVGWTAVLAVGATASRAFRSDPAGLVTSAGRR